MKKSSQGTLNILILSNYKGLRILPKLFLNDRFKFVFGDCKTQLGQVKTDIVIIDKLQHKKYESANKKIVNIILRDAQKSDASILALSGQLSTFGQNHESQFIPLHVVDFIVSMGLSILIRQMAINDANEKKFQTFQVSLIDLANYVGAFNISAKENGLLSNPLGKNMLDGGTPFYRLYKCKSGIIGVGNLEPKFYQQMIKGFKFSKQKQRYFLKNQFNTDEWTKITQILIETFLTKTASQWQQIMSTYDTCVTKVVQKPPQIEIPQPRIYSLIRSKI